jgi:hypothetical protein
MADNSQAQARGPQARYWLMLFVGAIFAVLGALMLWSAVESALHAVPATAKVIATEVGIGRKRSVHAQVEVTVPGQKGFRTEIEDALGPGTWVEGGTIEVVCAKLPTGSQHCELDSALDRWLFPVIIFAVGCGAIWLSLRRRKP